MKMISKISIVVFAVFCVFAIAIPYAFSQDYNCIIERVTPHAPSGEVYIMLTDVNGAFTMRWFRVPVGQENRFLATALAAIALNQNVVVWLDSINANARIRTLHVIAQ